MNMVKKTFYSTGTLAFVAGVLGVFCLTANCFAQDEEQLPAQETLTLETSDGVALNAIYFPGTNEKETIPVILLHGWEDSHISLIEMAAKLQEKHGYAVIVPDLRGHGKSNKTVTGDEIETDRWRADQVGTVIEDIEACKNFLIGKNNEGELNIDMLSVVAEEQVTILAAVWTIRDWSFESFGSRKQGQDVKSLILLNPHRSFKGINGNNAYRHNLFVGAPFPVMIAAERSSTKDAKTIFDGMMRGRKKLEDTNKHISNIRFEEEQQQRVVKSRGNNDRPLALEIGKFIEQEVFARRHDFRWAERGN